MAKSFLFLLFLFGIGYSVGPQFMESLKRDGIKPVLLAVVVCLTGLATATSVARFLKLDPGFAAGLLSGALTESPAMGTATEAINALPLPAADRTIMISHVAVADTVCYLFGAFFVILFCSQVGPKLQGRPPQGGSEAGARVRHRARKGGPVLGVAALRTASLSGAGRVGRRGILARGGRKPRRGSPLVRAAHSAGRRHYRGGAKSGVATRRHHCDRRAAQSSDRPSRRGPAGGRRPGLTGYPRRRRAGAAHQPGACRTTPGRARAERMDSKCLST